MSRVLEHGRTVAITCDGKSCVVSVGPDDDHSGWETHESTGPSTFDLVTGAVRLRPKREQHFCPACAKEQP